MYKIRDKMDDYILMTKIEEIEDKRRFEFGPVIQRDDDRRDRSNYFSFLIFLSLSFNFKSIVTAKKRFISYFFF